MICDSHPSTTIAPILFWANETDWNPQRGEQEPQCNSFAETALVMPVPLVASIFDYFWYLDGAMLGAQHFPLL
jgi:hypothetical protein